MSTLNVGDNLPDSYADRISNVVTVAFGDENNIHVIAGDSTYNVKIDFATGGYTYGSDSYDTQEEAFLALMKEVYWHA